MANHFQAWLDDADMPMFQDGQWFDLETGLPYNPSAYRHGGGSRTVLSDKAQAARDVAKAHGGKALKGSAKQKEWAEAIRAEKLAQMTDDQAAMACDPKGLLTHSKFWIEHRKKTGSEIGHFVMLQKALLKQAHSLKDKGMAVEYAEIARQYNALTAQWGLGMSIWTSVMDRLKAQPRLQRFDGSLMQLAASILLIGVGVLFVVALGVLRWIGVLASMIVYGTLGLISALFSGRWIAVQRHSGEK